MAKNRSDVLTQTPFMRTSKGPQMPSPDKILPQPLAPLSRIRTPLIRLACILFYAAFFAACIFLSACATPQERYKVLSFFFDGVPNPDAPKLVQQENTVGPQVITASIVSRHKPYLDGKCGSCHQNASGTIMEFDEAYKACVRCHTKIADEYPKMHGPVSRGACQWCHTGHDSPYPVLFRDDPIKVCTQCHDAQLLGPIPAQHTDGRTSCLTCHFGHGGHSRNFLKEGAVPQWPATQPATQPTTLPVPATLPAPENKPPRKLGLDSPPGAP